MNSFKLYIIQSIVKILPETRLFGLKRFLYRFAGVNIGENVRICSSVRILGNGELIIGNNTWIGHEALIISSSKIQIGANVDIAPRVYIGTGTHAIDINSSNIAGVGISKDIIIEDGCWLGVSSVILPSVILRKKCVIAAGTVLTKSFDETHFLIAGVPAKKIKSLLNK